MDGQGKKRALVIGISYKDSEFDELKYAEEDARAIQEILLTPDICDFKEEDIASLTGRVNSNDVRMGLGKTLKNAKENDLILIYFAGHGKLDEDEQLCLATQDTQKNMVRETSIPLDYIVGEIKRKKCKNSVFIIDSCYSGLEGETTRSEGDIPIESFTQMAGPGTVVLSASQAFQLARERGDIGHGIFTHYLIRGLKEGEADDGNDPYISITDLHEYVSKKVADETANKQVPIKWPPKKVGSENGDTEVFIAKSIKYEIKKKADIEKDERGARIEKIHVLYDNGDLSGLICSKALKILEKPSVNLSDTEKKYDKYIQDFLSGNITLEFLIKSWSRMEKSEQAEGDKPQTQANQSPQPVSQETNVPQKRATTTSKAQQSGAETNTPTTTPERNKIFISYSHKDKKWFDKLQQWLPTYLENRNLKIWYDTQIKPGEKWREEIKSALATAKFAILLVSQDFITSKFINEHELPSLLEAAEKEGLTIFWIAVRDSAYKMTKIEAYQSTNDPSEYLSKFDDDELDSQLRQICEKIMATIKT